MNISELINSPEELEPETIRHFLPDMSEEDFEWVMAARCVKQSTHFIEDMYMFENIMRAFNKLSVDFGTTQGIAPKHIWYGMDLIQRLWPKVDLQYSWEVKKYIDYMFNEDGVYTVYPYLDSSAYQELYDIALQLTNPEMEVPEETPLMAQRLAEMLLYTSKTRLEENADS